MSDGTCPRRFSTVSSARLRSAGRSSRSVRVKPFSQTPFRSRKFPQVALARYFIWFSFLYSSLLIMVLYLLWLAIAYGSPLARPLPHNNGPPVQPRPPTRLQTFSSSRWSFRASSFNSSSVSFSSSRHSKPNSPPALLPANGIFLQVFFRLAAPFWRPSLRLGSVQVLLPL